MKLLKKFMKYYEPYKGMFILDMLCAVGVSVIDLAFPQILNFLTKGLFKREPDVILRALFPMAVSLIVMYALRYVFRYYITSWGHIMGARMESNMRKDLFDHYQSLSFAYYDKNNTGDMMSKIVSDLFDISELAHHGPENLFICTLKIIGAFIVLLTINVEMTLILLAVTIVMIIFSFLQNKKMRAVFSDNRKKISKVNSSVQDSLAGIRVVKSFANEDIEKEKFDLSNNEFLKSKNSSYLRMGIFHAGNSFFQGLLYASILVAGGYFVATKSLNASDLAVYALYIGIFINPIEVLINFTEQFQKGLAGFKRFAEVMDTEPDIRDKPNAVDIGSVKGDIEYKNVSFRYEDDENVLDNINISIQSGKTIALVGPSGGGKTTLCSLLPRFYDVTGGSITIDGKNINDVTLKSLRNAIGIVQQDVYLFDGSIKENIAYGNPNATDEQIMDAAKKANMHDFIMGLANGYDTYVGERGTRLSGGQKQRISIARVFLKNPQILILDEATSALDNESEAHIQEALDKLAQNRTTIVIAHRLSTIRNADEIIVITENGIAERGTHSELMKTNGIYSRYYNMQFKNL